MGSGPLWRSAGLGLIPSILLMLLVQIGFSLFVFYKGVFQTLPGPGRDPPDPFVLIFVPWPIWPTIFTRSPPGSSIPTTLSDDTISIGKVKIAYQMVLAALAGILVTGSM